MLGGHVLLWLAPIVALAWVSRGKSEKIKLVAAVRFGPDIVRLPRRLAADPTVPRGLRVWLFVLLGYLLLPINMVPDFIPVIGYADDAIVVVLVLRFANRHAGPDARERHWPGNPQGLNALRLFAGID